MKQLVIALIVAAGLVAPVGAQALSRGSDGFP